MKKKIFYNSVGCDGLAGFKEGKFFPKEIYDKYEFIKSDKPDFVFYSSFITWPRHIPLFPNAVKIFFCGENVNPDFVFFDYWVGFDFLEFGDRFYRYPLCFWESEYTNFEFKTSDKKEYFCDFIYNHNDVNNLRKDVFDKLSEYKQVSSFGKLFNNTGIRVNMQQKNSIQSKSKFSLVIESCFNDGFITEKIMHSLRSGSIPIYFGTSKITKYFNSKRFINANDFNNEIDKVIEYVKKVDNDEKIYKEIISQPIFNSNFSPEELRVNYIKFLCKIFDNGCDLKRDVYYSNKRFFDDLKRYKKFTNFVRFGNFMRRIFRKK